MLVEDPALQMRALGQTGAVRKMIYAMYCTADQTLAYMVQIMDGPTAHSSRRGNHGLTVADLFCYASLRSTLDSRLSYQSGLAFILWTMKRSWSSRSVCSMRALPCFESWVGGGGE